MSLKHDFETQLFDNLKVFGDFFDHIWRLLCRNITAPVTLENAYVCSTLGSTRCTVHSNWTGFSKQIQEEEKSKIISNPFENCPLFQLPNENVENGFSFPQCRYNVGEKVAVNVVKTSSIKSILTKEKTTLG